MHAPVGLFDRVPNTEKRISLSVTPGTSPEGLAPPSSASAPVSADAPPASPSSPEFPQAATTSPITTTRAIRRPRRPGRRRRGPGGAVPTVERADDAVARSPIIAPPSFARSAPRAVEAPDRWPQDNSYVSLCRGSCSLAGTSLAIRPGCRVLADSYVTTGPRPGHA